MAVVWDTDLVFDPRLKENGEPISLQGLKARRVVCSTVINAIGGITVGGPESGVRWRGQADASWRVASRATRQGLTAADLQDHERKMINQARTIGIDNAQHMSDWEILARLRHNGAVTRLIDITTDPFVALFMLCDDTLQSEQEECDGVLLAVNRSELKIIDRPWEPDGYAAMTKKKPAALVYTTPPIDPRIAAQRGEFMFHSAPLSETDAPECELFPISRPPGWNVTDLRKLLGVDRPNEDRGAPRKHFPTLIGIRIPAEIKPMLRDLLSRNFGYTRETIYPDWAGLGEQFGRDS
ncbi:FRG domain-containing protein [Microbacterium trichothecenolyticum]|uniref:FRG domain-containing protein n=1 Tax=Microbacterium trichothecenolyticum TaxID=69370 RepID=A0ABU0TQF2_MICTR|nr:FRG domain-containing protein [Microbacterium trichothecenolyticum]MDQ1121901.1 hypothetical protein [Microbacterium trichothecenolyticum]